MKILSVNHTSDLYGASRCLERIASRFVDDGHELIVVIPKSGTLQKVLEGYGVRVMLHPWLPIIDRGVLRTGRAKLRLAFTFPVSVFWLIWIIIRHRIDLVHSNSAVVFSPALAAKLAARPHVWHIREFFFEFPSMWRYYERVIHRLSTAIIAISAAVRDQFSVASRPKIEVVYDGLPRAEFDQSKVVEAANEFKRRFRLTGRPLAGVIGRLKWKRKGQEVLIRAAALLRDKYPDAMYVVVGSPAPGNEDHLQRLRALVTELKLSDKVVFTGDIQDVRPVYAALDVSVAPPVDPEPFGCIVAESMAMSTPVVGSNAAGIAEQIVDGQNGLLFRPGSEWELAQALDRVFADHALLQNMRLRSITTVREKFDMDRCYEGYLRIFASIVSSQCRPHPLKERTSA